MRWNQRRNVKVQGSEWSVPRWLLMSTDQQLVCMWIIHDLRLRSIGQASAARHVWLFVLCLDIVLVHTNPNTI